MIKFRMMKNLILLPSEQKIAQVLVRLVETISNRPVVGLWKEPS